jgi:hypothetical protein
LLRAARDFAPFLIGAFTFFLGVDDVFGAFFAAFLAGDLAGVFFFG